MNNLDSIKLSSLRPELIKLILQLCGIGDGKLAVIVNIANELAQQNPDVTIGDLLNSQAFNVLTNQVVSAHEDIKSKQDGLGKCPKCHKLIKLYDAFPNL